MPKDPNYVYPVSLDSFAETLQADRLRSERRAEIIARNGGVAPANLEAILNSLAQNPWERRGIEIGRRDHEYTTTKPGFAPNAWGWFGKGTRRGAKRRGTKRRGTKRGAKRGPKRGPKRRGTRRR